MGKKKNKKRLEAGITKEYFTFDYIETEINGQTEGFVDITVTKKGQKTSTLIQYAFTI